MNKQTLTNSDVRELFRGRDGPDRQKDREIEAGAMTATETGSTR